MIAAVPVLFLTGFAAIRPSNDRNWVTEQAVLPAVTFHGDSLVTVHNVRNFDWSDSVPAPRYYDRTYDLRTVKSVSYIVTPFAPGWRGPAHTFVSFGFDDSTFVGISVEARKEAGETYTIAKGSLKRFEVMFVIADERDLIPLRANRWGDDVLIYPVRLSRAQARLLFMGMLRRAHELETKPEFYGSLRNNCTTNILDEANRVATKKIRYGWKVLLPGYSDELALEKGLLDTDLTLEQARQRFRINDRSRAYAHDPRYSSLIRAAP
jgi:hypothetical protein